jgi:hypothetical protein
LNNLNRACHNFKGVVLSSATILKDLERFEVTPAEFLRPFFQLSTRVKLRLANRERQIDDFSVILLDRDEYAASTRVTLDRHTREVIRETAPATTPPEMPSNWRHRGSLDMMLE